MHQGAKGIAGFPVVLGGNGGEDVLRKKVRGKGRFGQVLVIVGNHSRVAYGQAQGRCGHHQGHKPHYFIF